MKRFSLLCLLAAQTAGAFQTIKTDQYALPADQSIHEQLWLMANSAAFAGSIGDDLFVLANTISLAGSAANDAWLLGNTVEVSGSIADHARLAGGTLILKGSVSNSFTAVGAAVQLSTNSEVRGNVNAAANTCSFEGRIGGDLRVLGEKVTLSGSVGGRTRITANDIVVIPGATLGGDLEYTSPTELVLDPRVKIAGRVLRNTNAAAQPAISQSQILLLQLYMMLAALLAGVVFMSLFPRYSIRASAAIRLAPMRCSFAGVLTLGLVPMFAMAATITLVGIPLAVLLAASYAVFIYLAKLVTALAIGAAVVRRTDSWGGRVLALLIGLAVLYGLWLLPVAGSIVWFLTLFVGLGALVTSFSERPAAPSVPPPESQDQ